MHKNLLFDRFHSCKNIWRCFLVWTAALTVFVSHSRRPGRSESLAVTDVSQCGRRVPRRPALVTEICRYSDQHCQLCLTGLGRGHASSVVVFISFLSHFIFLMLFSVINRTPTPPLHCVTDEESVTISSLVSSVCGMCVNAVMKDWSGRAPTHWPTSWTRVEITK